MNKSVKVLDTVIKDGLSSFPDCLEHAKEIRDTADKYRKYIINKCSKETIYPFEGSMNDLSNIRFKKTANSPIAGKWKWMTVSFEFFNDDTYSYVNTESGLRTNGNYAISGNVVAFFKGSVDKAEFSLHGNRLTMTYLTPQRGSTVTFTRVH